MKYTAFIVLLFVTSYSFSQETVSWYDEDLGSGVIRVDIRMSSYNKSGSEEWIPGGSSMIIFNEEGMKLEESHYHEDGALWYKTGFDFRFDDFEVSEKTTDRHGQLIHEIIYFLNGETNLIGQKKKFEKGGKLRVNSVFTYDSLGRLIKMEDHYGTGKPTVSYYYYNDKDRLTEYKVEVSGIISYGTKYNHDDKGNNINSVYYDSKGDSVLKFFRKFNDKGDLVEEIVYDEVLKTSKKKSWTYQYDVKGNWIKKISFNSEGLPIEMIERDIQYFDE